jgi:integrase
MRLASIRRLDAEHYITTRLLQVSNDTVIKDMNVLKGLLTRAVAEEKIAFSPLTGFGKKNGMARANEGRVRYLEPHQLRAVLEHCPSWLRPIVGLLVATGMRRSECLGLRWFQVHRDQRQILLPKTKTHKPRAVHRVGR